MCGSKPHSSAIPASGIAPTSYLTSPLLGPALVSAPVLSLSVAPAVEPALVLVPIESLPPALVCEGLFVALVMPSLSLSPPESPAQASCITPSASAMQLQRL